MEKKSLLIIGAGISGLMAARLLADDFNITILEAQPRTGGRIDTQSLDGYLVEMGPEFVHGHLPISLSLLKEAGIETVAIEGKMLYSTNGRFDDEEEEDTADEWEALLEKMGSLGEDMSLASFLDKYFSGQASLQKQVIGYAEGFDLADTTKASVKKLYEEWQAEDEINYRIPTGYQSLIEFLEKTLVEKNVLILTNKLVNQVDWEADDITVYTKEEEKFYADKLLITVPISVLAKTAARASINFTPQIDEYEKAAQQIGYGSVLKIMIAFKEQVWTNDTGFIISDQPFRTWWTQAPLATPILTGWMGGPASIAWSAKTSEEIFDVAVQSLAVIFSMDESAMREKIGSYQVANPQENDFAMGGYSYATITSAPAIQILNKPVANTIFFAGEALYDGPHPGTVEAALVSAKQVAEKIKATI